MKQPLAMLGIACTLIAGRVEAPYQALADEPQPRQTAPSAPAAQAATDQAGVKTVLDALESAGRELQSIRCAVQYSTHDKLNETNTVKVGTILFKRAEPHPLFLIAFDKTVADDIVMRNKEWWLFRDRWLWEAKAKSGTIIKRELLAPGERRDFFDLEKSPIPMPFGQTADQVLASFDVRLVPPQVGDPPETDHLYCVPKPGGQLATEHYRLDYYVSRATHLPVRIVAESADQLQVETADFRDLPADDGKPAKEPLSARSINQPVSDGDFALPAETGNYHVSEEPLNDADVAGR